MHHRQIPDEAIERRHTRLHRRLFRHDPAKPPAGGIEVVKEALESFHDVIVLDHQTC